MRWKVEYASLLETGAVVESAMDSNAKSAREAMYNVCKTLRRRPKDGPRVMRIVITGISRRPGQDIMELFDVKESLK